MLASRAIQTDDELRLLQTVFWMHNPSRFQLGEHLGFSKSKITNLVNALLEQDDRGGRRPAFEWWESPGQPSTQWEPGWASRWGSIWEPPAWA
jgi:hypothetical protein